MKERERERNMDGRESCRRRLVGNVRERGREGEREFRRGGSKEGKVGRVREG